MSSKRSRTKTGGRCLTAHARKPYASCWSTGSPPQHGDALSGIAPGEITRFTEADDVANSLERTGLLKLAGAPPPVALSLPKTTWLKLYLKRYEYGFDYDAETFPFKPDGASPEPRPYRPQIDDGQTILLEIFHCGGPAATDGQQADVADMDDKFMEKEGSWRRRREVSPLWAGAPTCGKQMKRRLPIQKARTGAGPRRPTSQTEILQRFRSCAPQASRKKSCEEGPAGGQSSTGIPGQAHPGSTHRNRPTCDRKHPS